MKNWSDMIVPLSVHVILIKMKDSDLTKAFITPHIYHTKSTM